MNPTEIEFAVRNLVAKPHDPATFPFDLIEIFNTSKVTVSRLKTGQTNAAKQPGDVLWKKHLFFRPARADEDVGAIGDALVADPLTAKHKPRFILVTNGEQVHARDLQLDDTLNIEYGQLDESCDFLLPLAGYERRAIVEEHPADVKAAKKLKKLYDALLAANPTWTTGHHSHELNLLMTRLLFCFYAEKTSIFETTKIFTNTVTQYTTEDAAEVAPLLDRLFRIMNIEEARRPRTTPAAEAKFPYVNGSLFEDPVELPHFNRTARRLLLECGDLDWTTINPDIFGSMIQTVAQDGTRSDLGMHYTNVPNIMKVLQPLFLDNLFAAYEKAKDSVAKLNALLGRISKIHVFDPACGSGNFLVIAYKELRALEMQVLSRISEIEPNATLHLSGISLFNFFGIDIVDFACETAKLSLWIAEHQMNSAFKDLFGSSRPTLPLGKITTIRQGNALGLDWVSVCPTDSDAETYVCGNPPYLGHFGRTAEQNADMDHVFIGHVANYGDLDYVACWILKLTDYLRKGAGRVRGALVTTNSIYQGEQVPILWPHIASLGVTISFAYPTVKWENSATHNAGITCSIVGFTTLNGDAALLYEGLLAKSVPAINFYLMPASHVTIVCKEHAPISDLPVIEKGLKPLDGGRLTLTSGEREAILRDHPGANRFIRRLLSGDDLLNDKHRYIIVIPDDDLPIAMANEPLAQRLRATTIYRNTHGVDAKRLASCPNRFGSGLPRGSEVLAIPQLVAESRAYIPATPLDTKTVIPTQQVFFADGYEPWLLAIVSSRLIRLWMRIVGGKMRRDDRFSSGLVYNTFPLPALSDVQKRTLSDLARAILRARGAAPGKTLGYLYNPTTTPRLLSEAHQDNDGYIEDAIYGCRGADDSKRSEILFAMYTRAQRRKRDASLNFA